MKVQYFEMPQMRAANFNRLGGVMRCEFFGNDVRVVCEMPNPVSANLPWSVISDVSMPVIAFNLHILPSIPVSGGKLVREENVPARGVRLVDLPQWKAERAAAPAARRAAVDRKWGAL